MVRSQLMKRYLLKSNDALIPLPESAGDRHPLIRARRLALDERMVHAKPGGAGSFEETSRRNPILDQLARSRTSRRRNSSSRPGIGRAASARAGGGCPGAPSGIGKSSSRCMSAVKRATSLPSASQPPGIVAGVAADIVRRDLDAAFADGRGPHEIDGEPCEMRQALVRGGALDRPADQRRRRTGVLMVGIPGAAGEAGWRERRHRQDRYKPRPRRGSASLRAGAAGAARGVLRPETAPAQAQALRP